jgi:4-hydroxybenzoate polyprenyltransferase
MGESTRKNRSNANTPAQTEGAQNETTPSRQGSQRSSTKDAIGVRRVSFPRELLKPQKYITFIDFLAGFFVVVPPSAYMEHIHSLVLVFLSFQVLLYGGIYIVNDLFDLPSDRQHPKKKHRLIARRGIGPNHAQVIAIAFIAAGLLLSTCVGLRVLYFELTFLCLNLLYTWKLKEISYLDLLANAITHPLRVVFAFSLFGEPERDAWTIVVCVFFLYLALNSLRRHKELVEVGDHLRKALKGYTTRVLLAAAIACGAVLFSLVGFRSSIEALSLVLAAVFVYGAFLIGYALPRTWLGRLVDYALTH